MNERVEILLEELEELVLEIHRSAADLDYIIQSIRSEEDSDEEYFNMYVQAARELRTNNKRERFGNVDKSEELIWEEILEEVE